ncbi:MAG TPA: pimeloyl-CoA dehydrogenase small subunit, partial [Gammaproteobacteria bacterium]|nr:pimeloyl-CoA dehydrogenase small subunit [Gammaproteobacteria bacterium]
MNFDLSEEQQLLQDSVARFIEDNYALETRQHLVASDLGFSEPYWQTMADLGWLGINVPEAHGGIGGNQSDTMVLMQALGQGLVLEPIFASAILGTRAIVDGANEDTCTRLLPSLVSGERRLSV